MESQKLLISRHNPRSLAFSAGRPVSSATASAAKSISNEIVQKPPPSILEDFKALLKQRDDELRASGEEDVPPPTTEEIVQLYELVLSELTINSKPIITDLTIIAGEQKEHVNGIADAICGRILEAPSDQKLPTLYLLDSIVKNIGREYKQYFASRLPEVFCEAYKQVHPSLHVAMRHLFGTWSKEFPHSVLSKIERQIDLSQSVSDQSGMNPLRISESPRPTHGIHVNPKYLRQLEHAAADSDGSGILNSRGSASHMNFGLVAGKIQPSSTVKLGRLSSPPRIGIDRPSYSSTDEHAAENSTGRIIERESSSRSMLGRDEDLSEWQRNHFSDDNWSSFESSSMYSLSNGHGRQSPRALINAYGSDRREGQKGNSNTKPLLVECLDVNGIDKVASTSWQNTEEEEFDWEDMSPTLVDRTRSTKFLPAATLHHAVSSRSRPGFGTSNLAPLELKTRSSWPILAQLPPVDGTSTIAKEANAPLSFGRGSRGSMSGFHTEPNQGHASRYGIYPSSQSSQNLFNGRGAARDQMSTLDNHAGLDVKHYGSPTIVSRMSSSGLESVKAEARPSVVQSPYGIQPSVNLHTSHPLTLNSPSFPMQRQIRSHFDAIKVNNAIANQGPNKSLFIPEQHSGSFDNKQLQLPIQHAGLISLNQQNSLQVAASQQQFLSSQAAQQNSLEVAPTPAVPPFSHGAALNMAMSNSLPVPSLVQNIANSSLAMLPLRPGIPLVSSQIIPPQNAGLAVTNPQPSGTFSGLINSLVAQGFISLSQQTPVQDSLGTEFNPDVLKVRHESAINALYADLPRQCTTCGLRFSCQEDHSSHMDWHVTKNRMSKNRKQKPSRKWFVSQTMWLSGAGALGIDAAPGFLAAEAVEEKKDDEEIAVPADEEQNACALCGETFEEFYSDETEEWMYKGAVYLNAPKGITVGMDRSQLGPIVHAKCRSDSSAVASEDFSQDEGGTNGEGSQRKKLRS